MPISSLLWSSSHIDQLIKEYLAKKAFTATLKAFEIDLKSDKDKGFRAEKVIANLLASIHQHDTEALRSQWKHLETRVFNVLNSNVYSKTIRKLELNLYRLHLIHCAQNGKKKELMDFFEKFHNELHGNDDWKEWYALPHLQHAETTRMFSMYFNKSWVDTYFSSLSNFIVFAFAKQEPPLLVKQFDNMNKRILELEQENEELKRKLVNNSTSLNMMITNGDFEERIYDNLPNYAEMGQPFTVQQNGSGGVLTTIAQKRKSGFNFINPSSKHKGTASTSALNNRTKFGQNLPAITNSPSPSSSTASTSSSRIQTPTPTDVERPISGGHQLTKTLTYAPAIAAAPASTDHYPSTSVNVSTKNKKLNYQQQRKELLFGTSSSNVRQQLRVTSSNSTTVPGPTNRQQNKQPEQQHVVQVKQEKPFTHGIPPQQAPFQSSTSCPDLRHENAVAAENHLHGFTSQQSQNNQATPTLVIPTTIKQEHVEMETAAASTTNGQQQQRSCEQFSTLSSTSYNEHSTFISQCRFNHACDQVASLDQDGTIRVWTVKPHVATVATIKPGHKTLSICWYPCSQNKLFIGSENGILRLYDTRNKVALSEGLVMTSCKMITDITCHPKRQFVAVVCRSCESPLNKIIAWKIVGEMTITYSEVYVFKKYDCTSLSYDATGDRLFASDSSKKVMVFDGYTFQKLKVVRSPECVEMMKTNMNTSFIYAFTANGKVIKHDCMDLRIIEHHETSLNMGDFGDALIENVLDRNKIRQHPFVFSRCGKYFLAKQDSTVVKFNITEDGLTKGAFITVKTDGAKITSIDWSAIDQDGCRTLVVGTSIGAIHLLTLFVPQQTSHAPTVS